MSAARMLFKDVGVAGYVCGYGDYKVGDESIEYSLCGTGWYMSVHVSKTDKEGMVWS